MAVSVLLPVEVSLEVELRKVFVCVMKNHA